MAVLQVECDDPLVIASVFHPPSLECSVSLDTRILEEMVLKALSSHK